MECVQQRGGLETLIAKILFTKAYRQGVNRAISCARNVLEKVEGYEVTKVVVENEPAGIAGKIAYFLNREAIDAVVTFSVEYRADTAEHRMSARYVVFRALIGFLNVLPMLERDQGREIYYKSAELLRGEVP